MAVPEHTIYHVFSTFAVGGPQRRFAALAREMPAFHHVISAMDNTYDAQELLRGQCSYEIRPVEIEKGSGFSPANIRHLREHIKTVSAGLLCTYNWGSIEAVMANGTVLPGKSLTPHLHFEDGFGPDESPTRQNWKRSFARCLLLRNTRIIVPSNVLKNLACSKWGLNPKNVIYIPNGVNLERFQGGQRLSDERLVIGTLGALRKEKNFARLLRVYAQASIAEKARLVIAGDGPERAALQALTLEMGLQDDVAFSGHTENPEEVHATFDIFALSSDTEQMPIALLEAMACSLPVISTDVGDVAQMVAEENRRFILPLMDEDRLAQALSELVNDPQGRKTLGYLNRRRVEQAYSHEAMVSQYQTIFSQILR
ncbi:glycosyltransferase [Parvularcula sp. IMCC14364]|uniref:glycosyltransferase n=1 Tax=Parvularcula sp. IMCC14364 TaxID=3067902 RepID=UPI0027410FD4|nr:glycosyltransferase [Parvularcula sp. IMCC14364]